MDSSSQNDDYFDDNDISALSALGPGDEETNDDVKPPASRFRRRERGGEILGESVDPAKILSQPLPIFPKSEEIVKRLTKVAEANSLFKLIESEQLSRCILAMFAKEFNAGEVIIQQGDPGDNFYILETGIADVYINQPEGPPKMVYTYEGQGAFGELALMYNKPRAATIKARTKCMTWALDRSTFQKVIMKITMERRNLYTQALSQVPILGSLTSYERDTISDALKQHTFKKGDYVIKQGDDGENFYIITQGEVEVFKTDPGETEAKKVAHLGEWSFFGEIAILIDAPRAASVRVASDTLHAVSLDRESFTRVLGPCETKLRSHLDSYNLQPAESPKTGSSSPKTTTSTSPTTATTTTSTE